MEFCEVQTADELKGGGELTIAAMDEDSRWNIGRRTYRFVRRCMKDPVLREAIKARAAEIREAEAREAAAAQTFT